jgi:hypothetical protein
MDRKGFGHGRRCGTEGRLSSTQNSFGLEQAKCTTQALASSVVHRWKNFEALGVE